MKKMLTILKYEWINTVHRPSFLISLILIPLIPAVIVLIMGAGMNQGASDNSIVAALFEPAPVSASEGYVDEADLVKAMPDWVEANRFVQFENETAAQAAIQSGSISGFYIVPADYLDSGEVRYIRQDFSPLSGMDESYLFGDVLTFNLMDGDEALYMRYQFPLNVETVDLAPEVEKRDTNSPAAFLLPYAITFLFYIVVLTSSSLMLNSVSKEKENRMVEVLISSVTPMELFTGKIIALGLAGLLQTVVWFGISFLILRTSGQTLNIPESLQIAPSVLVWGVLFFIFGFLVYASLMAGIGAVVPNLREASQATFIVIIPVIIPLMMIGVTINQPHAPVSVILSLFPLTAPVAMMTRLAVGGIPFWQPALAIGLLMLTGYFVIKGVAGLFRAQTLLTGQKFSMGILLKAMAGKH